MRFSIIYTVDVLQVTDKVTCDTVGELIKVVDVIVYEHQLDKLNIKIEEGWQNLQASNVK